METFLDKKAYVNFHVKRKVTNLYKNMLFILEDLQQEEYNISDKVYSRMRKRILDTGNETIRELEDIVDQLKL